MDPGLSRITTADSASCRYLRPQLSDCLRNDEYQCECSGRPCIGNRSHPDIFIGPSIYIHPATWNRCAHFESVRRDPD